MGEAASATTASISGPTPALIAGRYRVEATLGRGAAGAVFSVLDTSTRRRVALKQLIQGATSRVRALFEQEYYTLAALQHPGIVEVYDYGSEEERPYYTMELLSGSDLHAHAPFPLEDACRIVSEAAAALSLLHSRRLVHRDISPRNVWRCADGRIKLIDFGALTPFGKPRDVVGTPPLVAPEALHGQPLDQRADLYSLGALLYWMLTGSHAFPARELRDLPELWSRSRVPLNRALAAASRKTAPPELEALVESLLSRDPLARPSHAGELIERIRASVSLPSDLQSAPQKAQLAATVLVGRDDEQAEFRKALAAAREGSAHAMLFEGESGSGRTRLLRELSMISRLAGVCTLQVEASQCDGPLGAARAIVEKAFEAAPEFARASLGPFEAALAPFAPVAWRARRPRDEPPLAAGEARARLLQAFEGWLVELSARVPVVLLVDDLERCDEASQVLLLTLAQRAQGTRLLCVASALLTRAEPAPGPMRSLRHAMRRFGLAALNSRETRAMVGALFGDVPNSTRLAERLFRATGGNPARLVGLADQLVQSGALSYQDGSWVLPQDLTPAQLVYDQAASLAARLARLSPEAHALGRSLSVHAGFIPPEMLKSVCGLAPKALFDGLEALVREQLLLGDAGGYRFADERARAAFASGLDARERKRAHARVGSFLLARDGLLLTDELTAHVHRLEGAEKGTPEAADSATRIAQIASQLMLSDPDALRGATSAIERAVQLLKAEGRAPHALLGMLTALTVAGYFIDRQLSVRYGGEALSALTRVLGLSFAQHLKPWLGRRLSLTIGLLWGALGFARRRKDRCVPAFPDAIRMYFHCVGSLSGVAAVCVDPAELRRFVDLSDLWTGLGPKHFTHIMHQFNLAMLATMQDRGGEARERWREVIARLETPTLALGMPEDARIRYLAGALYAAGVLECFADGTEALSFAVRLDQFGLNVCSISANQLRAQYYAHQGDLLRYEEYRERVELAAVKFGSAWQAEVWAPSAAVSVHMRTQDALAIKQALDQIREHARTIPSQVQLADRCYGALLVLRRRYAEAVAVLEKCSAGPAQERVGWARTHGTLARALNGLGEHQRAREVAERALSVLSPQDLELTAFNLGLQIEHALALAQLGERERATRALDALIAQHTPGNGPLTLGALHEARARVALLSDDAAACHEHFVRMEQFYRGTRIPSLIAHCERVGRELQRRLVRGSLASFSTDAHSSSSITSADEILSLEQRLTETHDPREQARAALSFLQERGPARAALWQTTHGRAQLLATQPSETLPSSVERWVAQRSSESAERDDLTETADLETVPSDPDSLEAEGLRWRLFWLRPSERAQRAPVGVLLLGGEKEPPHPGQPLLELLARHLERSAPEEV